MKAIHWIIAALGLAFVLPAPANAAQTDPEVIIYRFPGVRETGGAAGTGVATVFHCTNFSGVTETLRIVIRGASGALLTNTPIGIVHLETRTISTKPTDLFSGTSVDPGVVAQGTAAIAATTTSFICTAMIVDAASFSPNGISLRGIRFNPAPGSQE